ncbi:MAG: 4-alpha-glucanotransferase [Candidatus Omnitrophica bacterium]|nr:4-alpha-glucanotransferase [Candidatus Omnitrophota bacterium]MDD5042721.1 4-alpha-glucanotransferase [Candidatus Omnitrophota bacterium]MDD5500496.1 4-alpha-glucanotransferase [Candidatus Omnitrophota bacterium]
MREIVLGEMLSDSVSKNNWGRIGLKKRAGVLVPLFSVHSADSFGIGDLGDLKRVADWARETHNSIVQLLPMNEVGSVFCPYDALSSFALEPAYICLKDFPSLKDKHFSKNNSNIPHIDYSVKEEKIRLLWDFYLFQDLSEETDFEYFQRDNAYWLQDFALFKVLKEFHQGRPWYEWDEKFMRRNRQALQDFWKDNIEKVTFQMWMQWMLFRQFRAAREYSSSKGVLIKGDLPVLVSRDSADVWAHPGFFKLDFAAGAPPDMYCAKGQRWGMPTYNWELIASDGYNYIKEKLKYADNFYDILRIDHVVGLFRIWSIPYGDDAENQGLNGSFDPAEEELWDSHGRMVLNVFLENTKMLLCAEDLGVVPKCCTQALLDLGIPGNDVQRWVKDWDTRHDFLPGEEYRQLSVAMLSTHDTTNWQAWWKYEAGTVDEGLFVRKCADRGIDLARVKDELFDPGLSCHGRLRWKKEIDSTDKFLWILGKPRQEVGDFVEMYENSYAEKDKLWHMLGYPGEAREEADGDVLEKIIRFTLASRAVFCINSIIDILSLSGVFPGDPYQYRINTPGTISCGNWSLKLPVSLEEMAGSRMNRQIRTMINDSGRS